ncbi:MAG: hypothetical protein DWP97_09495 [Calditrichaeota bacterium]|nr:MAG: hypothetical protein DWP97_09495 [Calditrichota bacterium]
MKKMMLNILVMFLLLSSPALAQSFGYTSGCATRVIGVECVWFEYPNVFLPLYTGDIYLVLDPGLEYPTGVDEVYVEGEIFLTTVFCPFQKSYYEIRVSYISPCDECPEDYVGDLNGDSNINQLDLTILQNYLSGYGREPVTIEFADVNGDCLVDFDDIAYLDDFLNNGGQPPVDCACDVVDTCSFQNPGDVNNDGLIDLSDIAYLAAALEGGGSLPPIMANADPNGDCAVDQNDIDYLNEFLFNSGPPPVDCTCISPYSCLTQNPGDFNTDSMYDLSDITYFTNWLHNDGPAPFPLSNADANGDCIINVGDSKLIVQMLFHGGPPPVDCTCRNPEFMTVCCVDETGNVDYDPADEINIGDIVALVDFMFGDPSSPILCEEEADVDGISGVDVADLVYLVDYAFGDPSGPIPVDCF